MRATKVRTAVDTAIGIANLRFAYPDGVQALRGVDLTIAAGEKVALLGPNGAGKTTLLLHLNGILRGKGDMRIMGERLNNGNLKHFRAQVGLCLRTPMTSSSLPLSSTMWRSVLYTWACPRTRCWRGCGWRWSR